jgi:hypothetical protein
MRRLAAALAACAAVGGCGSPAAPTPSKVEQAQATHEYSASAQPSQRPDRTGSSPTRMIQAFANTYINWDAQTVTTHLRALAAASVGQARSAMELGAATAAHDYELQRGGVANSGSVEAVVALQGSANRYVVVTREQTTATDSTAYQGLRPAWHVTVATVTQLAPGAWVVSGWQPES